MRARQIPVQQKNSDIVLETNCTNQFVQLHLSYVSMIVFIFELDIYTPWWRELDICEEQQAGMIWNSKDATGS